MFQKLSWMYRLARAKSWLAMDEHDGIIVFGGKDPADFRDARLLTQQAGALNLFEKQLEHLREKQSAFMDALIQKEDADEIVVEESKPRKTKRPAKGAGRKS